MHVQLAHDLEMSPNMHAKGGAHHRAIQFCRHMYMYMCMRLNAAIGTLVVGGMAQPTTVTTHYNTNEESHHPRGLHARLKDLPQNRCRGNRRCLVRACHAARATRSHAPANAAPLASSLHCVGRSLVRRGNDQTPGLQLSVQTITQTKDEV